MEHSDGVVEWTSEKFIELRQQFVTAKSETAAFDVLQRLVAMDAEHVDDNAWIDCKSLILVLLEEVPVETMLLRQQVLLLHAIQQSPAHIVTTLASFYAKKPQATSLLSGEALAVAVAFARRINHTDTFEAIATLLAPVASSRVELMTELMHQLKEAERDSEHRFRLYQVLLRSLQLNFYDAVTLSPLLLALTDELTGHDVLSQLSALDILSDAAVSNRQAAAVLTDSGVTQKIYDALLASQESPDGGFLFTSCVKFFGSLCHCYPEAIDAFPAFVPVLLNMVRNYEVLDASQRMLSVETLAHVAYSADAKGRLQAQQGVDALEPVMRSLCLALGSGPSEMRARVVDSVRMLLENGADELLARWVSWMPDLPAIITAYVTRPFAELRLATIHLLAQIVSKPFGCRAMLADGTQLEKLADWLCDPASETDWQCSLAKRQLVGQLLAAGCHSEFLSPELLTRLRSSAAARAAHHADPAVATMEL